MREAPQTYKEYVETMRAYGFRPMDDELWSEWQAHWNRVYERTPKQ